MTDGVVRARTGWRERLGQSNILGTQEAVRLLRHAVELDPKLARAWAGLFHAYDVLAFSGADSENSRRLASEAAEWAVSVDLPRDFTQGPATFAPAYSHTFER